MSNDTAAAGTFFDVYRAELLISVRSNPEHYRITPTETPEIYAARTADKMIAAMRAARGVAEVDTQTATFRRTCKRLGIANNRAAMTRQVAADMDREGLGHALL